MSCPFGYTRTTRYRSEKHRSQQQPPLIPHDLRPPDSIGNNNTHAAVPVQSFGFQNFWEAWSCIAYLYPFPSYNVHSKYPLSGLRILDHKDVSVHLSYLYGVFCDIYQNTCETHHWPPALFPIYRRTLRTHFQAPTIGVQMGNDRGTNAVHFETTFFSFLPSSLASLTISKAQCTFPRGPRT